ncbi:ribbon-helix-helix domain-containing protein [Pseudoclavibacter helvolus]|uniref:Putative DNA repair protein MutK n=1 Tax=Pseudoclavibacter helvolus TaxID=255205 RepID=A0A7W4URX9_9MICO|nr:ribbon-helix-helix domain-containing protein [Pseudoclavibacter helvolus]MBB2959535.1 putative DNA repair protein MutK [Pseudoclavibacter helvolus]
MSESKNMFTAAGRTARPQRAKAGERTQAAAVEEESVYHSARVPLSLSKEIKKLALEEGTSQQALTVEALRLLLASRN